jgi:hypothetical protein
MQSILSLTVEFALVAITVSAIQFLVLLFRNPRRPQWLRGSIIESAAVICIVMGITVAVAILASGLIGAGLNVFVSLVVSAIVPLAVAFGNWRLFQVGERLRHAETGASPFAPLSDKRQSADPAQPASR